MVLLWRCCRFKSITNMKIILKVGARTVGVELISCLAYVCGNCSLGFVCRITSRMQRVDTQGVATKEDVIMAIDHGCEVPPGSVDN